MSHFAAPNASWNDGDFDGDSFVSLHDLVLVALNFDVPAVAPSSMTIPEPSSAIALAAAIAVLAVVARRRRR